MVCHATSQTKDKNMSTEPEVICEIKANIGLITLNRPKALNALSLNMIREITSALLSWERDIKVKGVVVRGMSKEGLYGAFCAGGDIRFFHQAALSGSPLLDDFFTEEYALNHLIHRYTKPYIALMDGIVMGGGMGISQGASLRIVTERTKMAMPETNIGLFPDVGGGYFLSRCEGHIGEYLALTGHMLSGREAVYLDLADLECHYTAMPQLVDALTSERMATEADVTRTVLAMMGEDDVEPEYGDDEAFVDRLITWDDEITEHFSLPTMNDIIASLESCNSAFGKATAAILRKRSPLMLHVTLEQIRRARDMSLADDLRMERDLVRNAFSPSPLAGEGRGEGAGVMKTNDVKAQCEAVEGIRALAVDKDHTPKWQHARIEDVKPEEVKAFFTSPWPAHAHPLRELK
jgi:enoyl-CoA hydratase/carnithine racemase